DDEDAFPTDPNEDTDTDGDGTGDNTDLDIDGDGIPNVDDQFPFSAVADSDNDGTPNDEDAFPTDPNEDTDTDGDGIGDNADPDDDNDGFTDMVEITEGTDAKSASHFPLDTDGDGIPDSQDSDMDGDGVPNGLDAFPLAATPVLVPAQAFTPGGDGINDTWVVPGIDNYPNNVVRLYNRWGHEVFAAKGYRNDWGGNHKGSGSLLPPGSYLYVIDLGNGTAPLQGWVFINY
ncbi:gliding motility-associated C-terminal domain-containing protein, partial [Arenibacter sp. GZD96]|uniref:gliding motility-associated C-terminal domain-containing protein n=1 Tax=Aurantibrevibacter litoralis TaxID=3106030 RepID=UPI002AFFA7A8